MLYWMCLGLLSLALRVSPVTVEPYTACPEKMEPLYFCL